MSIALVCGALSCALGGCGGPDFLPAEFVEGLRVLGARAEPAAVAPGQRARVEALIVDTAGRTITADWQLCRVDKSADPSATIVSACASRETGPDLVPVGSGAAVEFTMPMDLNIRRLGAPDFTTGYYVPVVLRARVAGADPVTAVFRVRLYVPFLIPEPVPAPPECRQLQPPNTNPTISRVEQRRGEAAAVPIGDNEVIEVRPREEVRLRGLFADGSAESYCVLSGTSTMLVGKTAKELPNLAWFTSGGEIAPATTGEDKETTLTAPSNTGAFNVWVVARDERGGSDWRQLAFTVR